MLLNLPAFDSVSQGDLVAAEKQEAAARKKAKVRITSHLMNSASKLHCTLFRSIDCISSKIREALNIIVISIPHRTLHQQKEGPEEGRLQQV